MGVVGQWERSAEFSARREKPAAAKLSRNHPAEAGSLAQCRISSMRSSLVYGQGWQAGPARHPFTLPSPLPPFTSSTLPPTPLPSILSVGMPASLRVHGRVVLGPMGIHGRVVLGPMGIHGRVGLGPSEYSWEVRPGAYGYSWEGRPRGPMGFRDGMTL